MSSKLRCAGCHQYIDKEDAIRVGIQSFCSYACRLPKKKDKEHKPTTARRKSRKPTDFRLRRKVRERDKWCRYCGTTQNLHVHHIQYRSQGGADEESNLITLCLEHHALVHSSKERFAPLCFGVLWLTYKGKHLTIPEFESSLHRSSSSQYV